MNPIESKWKKWDEFKNETRNPDVYVICLNKSDISGTNESIYTDSVVYIGMTISKNGLRQRLSQFNNVINGKSGHGGADRFMNDFKLKDLANIYYKIFEFPIEQLPVGSEEYYLVHGEVVKFEFVLFAKCMKYRNTLPKYNLMSSPKKSKK